jgi:hypothetical protein
LRLTSKQIHSVTRHAKNHAKSDLPKLKKIEELSGSKFNDSTARWNAYVLIFREGKRTDQIDYPFRMKSCQSEQEDQFLQVLMEVASSNEGSSPHLLSYLETLERLRAKKAGRERQIGIEEKEQILAANQKASREKEKSNAQFFRDFGALIAKAKNHEQPDDLLADDEMAVPRPSKTKQDSVLLYAGANMDEITENSFRDSAFATVVDPLTVPFGDRMLVANNMARSTGQAGYQHPQEPMAEHVARYSSLISAPQQHASSPVRHPQNNLAVFQPYYQHYPQHPSSDPGYASGSYGYGANDIQSSELSTSEFNNANLDYETQVLSSLQTQEMESQQYVDPASVEKRGWNGRR